MQGLVFLTQARTDAQQVIDAGFQLP